MPHSYLNYPTYDSSIPYPCLDCKPPRRTDGKISVDFGPRLLVKKLVLLRFLRLRPAPQPGTLRWGDFLPDEKVTKESPKAGPSPALWNPPRGTECACILLFLALGPVGSHRWRRNSTESTYFSGRQFFYPQGLVLVSRCSQLSVPRLPAAATPLGQDRPGHGNCPVIGPAAMVAWCGGTSRGHSKGDGPNIGLTQFQPRTPGRSLGGNALSGFWFLLPAQKKPPAGSVPTRLASLLFEKRRSKSP